MKDEQIDRLLDEGLKNYSRVETPGGLAERVVAGVRGAASQESPKWTRRWWLWAPVPALAAALLILAVLLPHSRQRVEPQSAQNQPPVPIANEAGPAGETPALPGGETPALPGGETPALPGGRMPALPGGRMPALPGGETPAQTGDAGGAARAPAVAKLHKPALSERDPRPLVIEPRRGYRTLTPEELASVQLRPEMLPTAQPAELVVPDLVVPDLKVPTIQIQPVEPEKGLDH